MRRTQMQRKGGPAPSFPRRVCGSLNCDATPLISSTPPAQFCERSHILRGPELGTKQYNPTQRRIDTAPIPAVTMLNTAMAAFLQGLGLAVFKAQSGQKFDAARMGIVQPALSCNMGSDLYLRATEAGFQPSITQPPVPTSYGTGCLSSRRSQAHPNHLAGRFYASRGRYRRPSRETLRSEHSFPRRRAAGSHLPGGQYRGPHAGDARKPQVRGGLLRKESRDGS